MWTHKKSKAHSPCTTNQFSNKRSRTSTHIVFSKLRTCKIDRQGNQTWIITFSNIGKILWLEQLSVSCFAKFQKIWQNYVSHEVFLYRPLFLPEEKPLFWLSHVCGSLFFFFFLNLFVVLYHSTHVFGVFSLKYKLWLVIFFSRIITLICEYII